MGICKHCGQSAGIFRSVHPECETRHSSGTKAVAAFVQSLSAQSTLPASISGHLNDLARTYRLSPQDISKAVLDAWSQMLDRYLDDGILSREEEATLVTHAQQLGLTREMMDSVGVYNRVAMGRALRDVVEGNVPVHQPQTSPAASVNLQKNERVVWTFANVLYSQEVTRHEYVAGTSGVSFRVAKGVYYRVGRIRGHSVPITEMKQIDQGALIIATKNVYFAGSATSFRIPYTKIVAFQPYSDALGIVKDGARAKPQIFRISEGWFVYNLVMNVSQW